MAKSVWYISKYFAPETEDSPGGRGWLLMEELAKQGYRPTVFTSDSNQLIEPPKLDGRTYTYQYKGVQLIWLKTLKYLNAKSIRRVMSWVHFEWNILRLDKSKLTPPNTVIASSLSLLSIFNGLILKNRYGCKLVFEVRDIWPLTLTEEGGFSKKNPFVRALAWVEKLAYRKSDAIIGTMPNLKEHVDSVIDTNTTVYCIPMGVPPVSNRIQESLDESFKSQYFSQETFKVVHAGTVGITNALDTLFEAAEKLKLDSRFEFFIVGDGPLKKNYQAQFAHLTNVTFVPKVKKTQVQAVLNFCDVVYFSVFPSKVWNYGQSLNKVVDYMLSGKPIVASYSGYPSMIDEAGCGSFVAANNVGALVQILQRYEKMSVAQRSAIGERGKVWIEENRSYPKLASELAKIIE